MLLFDEGIKDKRKLKSKETKTEEMGPGLGFSTLTLTHSTATGLFSKYLAMGGGALFLSFLFQYRFVREQHGTLLAWILGSINSNYG